MKPTFLFFCFLPVFAFSQGFQPGYVILNTGDTLHGYLKHPFGSPYGFVFKDSNKIKKDFGKGTVTGFFIEKDGLYRNIVFEKDGLTHMVNVRIQNYLSYYEVQLGVTTDSYFHILEKTGDITLKSESQSQCWYSADLFSGFKDKLINFLSDDPPLCDKIRHGEYTKKDVLNIVADYNSNHQTK
jgi:hypothetical protein